MDICILGKATLLLQYSKISLIFGKLYSYSTESFCPFNTVAGSVSGSVMSQHKILPESQYPKRKYRSDTPDKCGGIKHDLAARIRETQAP